MIATLLLGLYDDAGEIDYVGSAAVAASRHAAIAEQVLPLLDETSDRRFSEPNRWGGSGLEEQPLRPELVAEVRYDKVQGRRFRHGTKLLRFRPDKDPGACTWAELRPPRDPDGLTVADLLVRGYRGCSSDASVVAQPGRHCCTASARPTHRGRLDDPLEDPRRLERLLGQNDERLAVAHRSHERIDRPRPAVVGRCRRVERELDDRAVRRPGRRSGSGRLPVAVDRCGRRRRGCRTA